MTNATSKCQRKYLRRVLKSIAKNDPNTKEVVLNGFPFQDKNIASLAMSLVSNTHVRILYLHNCGISARGAHLFAYALSKNTSIEHLWLNSNAIGSAGAEAIANALRENRTLKTLGLGDNDIGNHGGKRIKDALKHNDVITDIFLMGNRMSESIVNEICRRCHKTTHNECCQQEKDLHDSCRAIADPLEDLDASTVMSSVTSSYTRKMLESIEEECEGDKDDDEADSDDSSMFDRNNVFTIADLSERLRNKQHDRLSKLRSFGQKFTKSRIKGAHP